MGRCCKDFHRIAMPKVPKPYTMTILIADDHPMSRSAMIHYLQPEFSTAKFLQAANGREVVRLVQEEEVHLLVLDIQMPQMDGYEVVDVIFHQAPKLKVIISSLIETLQAIDYFFDKGVKGYVTKAADPEEFLEAVKVVVSGGLYIQKDLSGLLANKAHPVNMKLSPREKQILRQLSMGLSAAQIAEDMGLSVRTVEDYKALMMKKAQAKNAAELVRFFYENGLN